jgi:DnaK suppressor protein
VTTTVHRPTELLRSMLEERLRTHTNCLTQLTVCGAPPASTGHDDDTVAALAAAARQGVANATQALHRMSQGTYGVCEACGKDIPLGRLRNLPHVRFCVPCQRRAAQRLVSAAPYRAQPRYGGCEPPPIQAGALSMKVPPGGHTPGGMSSDAAVRCHCRLR